MTKGCLFCYYIDMTKKDSQLKNKKLSSEKGKDFLVQSNIDDFLNENKNINDVSVLENEKENFNNDETRKKINEQQTTQNEVIDKNEEENLIEVKIENEELKTEDKKLLQDAFEIEKKIEKEAKNKLTNDNDEKDEVALQKKKLDEIEQSVSKQNSKKSKITNLVFFFVNILIVGGLMAYQILQEDFCSFIWIAY